MLWDRSGSRAQGREEHGTFCALFGIVVFFIFTTFDYIYTVFSLIFKFSFLSVLLETCANNDFNILAKSSLHLIWQACCKEIVW